MEKSRSSFAMGVKAKKFRRNTEKGARSNVASAKSKVRQDKAKYLLY